MFRESELELNSVVVLIGQSSTWPYRRTVRPHTWCTLGKLLHWGGQLLLADFLVLLGLGLGPETLSMTMRPWSSNPPYLPRKGALEEVYQDVAQGLHVVSTRLFCQEEGYKIV